jgi:hypothetical protein
MLRVSTRRQNLGAAAMERKLLLNLGVILRKTMQTMLIELRCLLRLRSCTHCSKRLHTFDSMLVCISLSVRQHPSMRILSLCPLQAACMFVAMDITSTFQAITKVRSNLIQIRHFTFQDIVLMPFLCADKTFIPAMSWFVYEDKSILEQNIALQQLDKSLAERLSRLLTQANVIFFHQHLQYCSYYIYCRQTPGLRVSLLWLMSHLKLHFLNSRDTKPESQATVLTFRTLVPSLAISTRSAALLSTKRAIPMPFQ